MSNHAPEFMSVVKTRYRNQECKAVVLYAHDPADPFTHVNLKVYHDGGSETVLNGVPFSAAPASGHWSW